MPSHAWSAELTHSRAPSVLSHLIEVVSCICKEPFSWSVIPCAPLAGRSSAGSPSGTWSSRAEESGRRDKFYQGALGLRETLGAGPFPG